MNITQRLNFTWKNQLPIMRQTEVAECGLACLAMVVAYHGYETDLPSMRSRFSLSLQGMTLKDLVDAANELKLNTRALQLDMDNLKNLSTPCILHWDLNHFVVLKKVQGNKVEIHDPARGFVRLTLEEVSKHFTGIALELNPMFDFIKGEKKKNVRLRDLFGQTVGLRRALSKIFILALILQLFSLGTPFFSQMVFDQVLVSSDNSLLTILTLVFSTAMLIEVLVTMMRDWVLMQVSASFNLQWASNVFKHLLRLPMDWFEKRHLGDITSRFQSVGQIEKMLTTQLVEAMLDMIMTVGSFTMLWIYSPTLSLITLAALVLYSIFRWFYYGYLRRESESQLVYGAKADTYFLETLRSIQTIRLFNATPLRHASWLNYEIDKRNSGLQIQKLELLNKASNQFLFGAEKIIIMWLGAKMVMANELSIGMLVAILAFKDQFSNSAGSLVNHIVSLKMMRLQSERLSDIILTKEEADTVPINQDTSNLKGNFELRNISFRYADNLPWVIRNCSLHIKAGESVAIVGKSGRGKTTLMKIMLGLLEPQEGQVLFDGQDIRKIGLQAYRNDVSVVMQDDNLLSGSIAENITFFTPPDAPRMQRCAKLAKIDEEINQMPMGYASLVGDLGATLSGGQKQRLLLARALYRQPKILFLDEATSHLDGQNEQAVNQGIQSLNLTKIIIAHRASTIEASDRVIEL